MEAKKQYKATNSAKIRDTTLTFRTEKRIKALTEVAARSQGIKMSNYVEQVLVSSFDNLMVDQRDEGESGIGDRPSTTVMSNGRPLSVIADELYDDDDFVCLFKRINNHVWALSHEQIRLYELLQISSVLRPKRYSYNESAIREHWDVLSAVADGRAPIDSLPCDLFADADVAFALMSETERVALYRKSPEEFMRRSKDHMKQTKRSVK
jgi:hypothetical protein